MYKVFIDNAFILFRKSFFYQTELPKEYLPYLKRDQFDKLKAYLNPTFSSLNINILTPNPLHALRSFFKELEWIEAAGGIVINKKTQRVLFIYRNKKWDIPKGKIEDKESPEDAAIREIQEECGLQNLEIIHSLSPTFHCYRAYDNHWIKKTYWYVLETEDTTISPQLEEGITEGKWFNVQEISSFKEDTFSSLKEVIDEFIVYNKKIK